MQHLEVIPAASTRESCTSLTGSSFSSFSASLDEGTAHNDGQSCTPSRRPHGECRHCSSLRHSSFSSASSSTHSTLHRGSHAAQGHDKTADQRGTLPASQPTELLVDTHSITCSKVFPLTLVLFVFLQLAAFICFCAGVLSFLFHSEAIESDATGAVAQTRFSLSLWTCSTQFTAGSQVLHFTSFYGNATDFDDVIPINSTISTEALFSDNCSIILHLFNAAKTFAGVALVLYLVCFIYAVCWWFYRVYSDETFEDDDVGSVEGRDSAEHTPAAQITSAAASLPESQKQALREVVSLTLPRQAGVLVPSQQSSRTTQKPTACSSLCAHLSKAACGCSLTHWKCAFILAFLNLLGVGCGLAVWVCLLTAYRFHGSPPLEMDYSPSQKETSTQACQPLYAGYSCNPRFYTYHYQYHLSTSRGVPVHRMTGYSRGFIALLIGWSLHTLNLIIVLIPWGK